MSTAVLRAPGAVFSPAPPSSVTSTITGALSAYAQRFVSPFTAAASMAALTAAPAANEPTGSAIERDRFSTPAGLLIDALLDAAKYAAEAPTEQRLPTAEAMREAITVLRMLPPDVEMPEPVIEPAGALSWLWDRGANGFLVLAVDGRGRVQRSAVIEGKESWGTSPLSATFAPEEISLLGHFRASHA